MLCRVFKHCVYMCVLKDTHEVFLYIHVPFYIAWDKSSEYYGYESLPGTQAADICQKKQYGRE